MGGASETFASRWWALASLILLALAVYGNSYPGAWVFDDPYTIAANPDIGTLWPPSAALSGPPGAPSSGRPLTALSFHMNAAVGGIHAPAFRLVNVLIHAANAALLFLLVRRLLRTSSRWSGSATVTAWCAAALWAVHPINTSSVTYISQRAESLMTLFFLGALLALVRLGERGVSRGWSAAAFACICASTLAKDVGAMIPLLVVPFERAYASPTWREAWEKRKRLALLALAVTWGFLAVMYLSDPRQGTVRLSYQGIDPWSYLCTQAAGIVMYLRKVFWPDVLILDYGWPIAQDPSAWLPQALLLALLLGAGLAAMVRRPAAGFPVVMFFAVLAPSSSVIPVITEILAEHRMYLPSAIVLTGAAMALVDVARRLAAGERVAHRAALAATLVAVACLGARTVAQNTVYRDPVALWRHNAEATPLNRRVFYNLGHELRVRGDLAGARAAFGRALALSPDYPDAHAGMSYAWYDDGAYAEALPFAVEALRLQPDDPEHAFTLAMIHAKSGRREEALDVIRQGLVRSPDSERLKNGAVVVYFLFDDVAKGLEQLAYWSGLPRPSREFLMLAAELADSAGKAQLAAALRSRIPRDSAF